MQKGKMIYNCINIMVILLTAIIFICKFYDLRSIFDGKDVLYIAFITVNAVIVHSIKAGRMYLALYGENLNIKTYLKIYFKVTPVSMIFPYKLGEFFRMYFYGIKLKNLFKGIITVILDRFMDTMALLTILLLVWLFSGGYLSVFTYILLLFLTFILLIYLVYPGVYRFWKKYILRSKATENKLKVLKLIHMTNNIYMEIKNIVKGRGVILYFMSLIAWIIEIGSFALINGIMGDNALGTVISDYLSSAIGNGTTVELDQFIFISVIFTITMYLMIKIFEFVSERKKQQ